MSLSETSLIRWLTPIATLTSLLVMGLGASVWVSWLVGLQPLRSLAPGLVAMNPLTALSFFASGVALWILRHQRPDDSARRLARALAIAVVAAGLARLWAFGGGLDLGIDRWFFTDQLGPAAGGVPDRMAAPTAFAFVLSGTALATLDFQLPRGRRPAQFLAFAIGALGALGLAGYLFSAVAFTGAADYIPMALHTALGFLLLATGLLCARPRTGVMRAITRESPGGNTIRRLLPAFAILPMLVAWTGLAWSQAGLHRSAFSTALVVLAMVSLTWILIWRHARQLDALDAERRDTAGALARMGRDQVMILNAAGDGILRVGPDQRTTYANPAAARLLGESQVTLIGRPISEWLKPLDETAGTDGAIAATLQDGTPRHVDEALLVRKSGLSLPVSYTCTPLMGHGRTAGAVVVIQDITGPQAAKQALLQAKRDSEAASGNKSIFLANMSHELRTPLNAILSYSEELREAAEAEGRLDDAEALGVIHSAGDHLLELINDVLDLSKIEAGKMEAFLEPTDIGALVHDVAAMIRPLADKNHNQLVVAIDPGLPELLTDAMKLRQILFNLLSNACKFTHDGVITLSAGMGGSVQAEELVLSVKDTGVGMSAEQQARLFQAFVQADAGTSRKYGGTGLGLSISQRFSQMLGGAITVASAPDQGAAFTVRLPVLQPAEPVAPAAPEPAIVWLPATPEGLESGRPGSP